MLKKIIPTAIKHKISCLIAIKKYGIRVGKNCYIDRKSVFEGDNAIFNNTQVCSSFIGIGTYIANNSLVSSVKVGRYCSLGDNLRTGLGLHPSHTFVSTHPSFFSTQKQAGFTFVENNVFQEHKYVDSEKKYIVHIGNDVWIGNNVIIMDGITVGDGAIIGSGAIVTKDVAPYSISVGVPAKVIKYRFSSIQISFLLKFKWWNKDKIWLKENAELISNIDLFYKIYSSN